MDDKDVKGRINNEQAPSAIDNNSGTVLQLLASLNLFFYITVC